MEASDAPSAMRIWAMIESPLAILNIATIAEFASKPQSRLDCLVLGSNDLVRETGIAPGRGREYLLPWMMQLIAATRAYRLDVLDGVFNDFGDIEGLESECRQARDIGFGGKTLIHPSQVEPANRLFAPTDLEIEAARAIIDAFSQEQNHNLGVIQINGKMVERLHLEMAEQIVARAAQVDKG